MILSLSLAFGSQHVVEEEARETEFLFISLQQRRRTLEGVRLASAQLRPSTTK